MYRYIGNIVNHSDKTIILDENYGYPVEYFSEILGRHWPNKGQIAYSKNIAKMEALSAQMQFSKIVGGKPPEYFIITDFKSFNLQAELRELLNKNFKILYKTESFVIYDLRTTITDSEF